MNDTQKRIWVGVYATVSTLFSAASLALATGGSWITFGKLWLIMGMNFVSLPLLFTPHFQFPFWVWYVVVLWWVGQGIYLVRYMPDR